MQKTNFYSVLRTSAFSLMVMVTLSAFISINNSDDENCPSLAKQNKSVINPAKEKRGLFYTLKELPSGAYEVKIHDTKKAVTKRVIIE